ncbi:MAG: hypothetical protein IK082_02930 [Oscillospiraceae bacterium]|nr:hypothetical protein [Oscillospiraceae bacterium]
MKMKKTRVLRGALEAVFLILFNLLFYVLGGTKHPTSVWIAYGFIHFAYLMVVVTPYLTHQNRASAVFGMSLYTISAVYFVAELIIGLLFIFTAPGKATASFVIQAALALCYLAILFSVQLANQHTSDNLERQEMDAAFIVAGANRLNIAVQRIEDREVRKNVEHVYDLLHASPVRSSEAARITEKSITEAISELEEVIAENKEDRIADVCKRLTILIKERNTQV